MVKIRSNLPVIVCSGHSDLIDSEVTNQPGIKAFLARPIHMIEFKNKVREVYNNQSPVFARMIETVLQQCGRLARMPTASTGYCMLQ